MVMVNLLYQFPALLVIKQPAPFSVHKANAGCVFLTITKTPDNRNLDFTERQPTAHSTHQHLLTKKTLAAAICIAHTAQPGIPFTLQHPLTNIMWGGVLRTIIKTQDIRNIHLTGNTISPVECGGSFTHHYQNTGHPQHDFHIDSKRMVYTPTIPLNFRFCIETTRSIIYQSG